MNLADIRKKANRDREDLPDQPVRKPPAAPVELILEDPEEQFEPLQDRDAPVPEVAINLDICRDEDPEDVWPEFTLTEEEEADEPPAQPPVIATPGIPASSAIAFAAATSSPIPGTDIDEPDLPAAGGSPADAGAESWFNPLEILLAGRAASGGGTTVDAITDEDPGEEAVEYQEFLCFRVCSERYAVNIMEIREIIKPREVTEVPRSPDFITGVLSLRGIIIPVFNMMKRLHLEPAETGSRERIIVVSRGEELFGIHVDEVLQVVKIPDGGIEHPPAVLEGIDREFVLGIGHYAGGMLILLNMGNILDVTLH